MEKRNYFIASMCFQNQGNCIYEKPRNTYIHENAHSENGADGRKIISYEAFR